MRWVNCYHFNLSISRIRFACFRFCQTVKQTWVNWQLFEKTAPWCYFLRLEFGNGRLCCLLFTTEVPKRKFQRVSISIWGQSRGFEKSWMSPMVITKVQLLRSLSLIVLIKKKSSRICCCDPDHNWQRSKQVIQVHSQESESVWVFFHQADNA